MMLLFGQTASRNKVCRGCSVVFRDASRYNRSQFCTKHCRWKDAGRRFREIHNRFPVRECKCEWCELEFTTRRPAKRFCSVKCQSRALSDRRAKRHVVTCGVCPTRFKQSKLGQMYCSKRCCRTAQMRKWRVKEFGAHVMTPCSFCGTSFLARGFRACYCSARCKVNMNNVLYRDKKAELLPRFKMRKVA